MNRGVERRDIFLDDGDRRTFLALLARVVPRFRWRLHAYVLMPNHYHLLIETLEPTLSRGMQRLGGDYAEAFNVRRDRVGHLFGGRFKAHLIDSEAYLLEVARYIVLNPVRASFVATPHEWTWSSYHATVGAVHTPQWLTTSAILDRFDPWSRDKAASMYEEFVRARCEDKTSPWAALEGQVYLGSDAFIESVQRRIEERERSPEHPRPQRIVRCASVDEVVDALRIVTGESIGRKAPAPVRLAYAELAHTEALAPLHQIGASLGIKSSGARYLIRRAGELRGCDADFTRLLEEVRLKIRNCKLQM